MRFRSNEKQTFGVIPRDYSPSTSPRNSPASYSVGTWRDGLRAIAGTGLQEARRRARSARDAGRRIP